MLAFIFALLFLFSSSAYAEEAINYNPNNKPLQQKVLGITREQWIKDLSNLEEKVCVEFVDILLKEEKALKSKRSSEHFEKLDSVSDKVERIRNNPLHSGAYHKKRFIPDLTLRQSDYVKIFSLIPYLKQHYRDPDVAAYLAHCALAINSGMRFSDILFYARREIHMETPIDIALDRLYREIDWQQQKNTE